MNPSAGVSRIATVLVLSLTVASVLAAARPGNWSNGAVRGTGLDMEDSKLPVGTLHLFSGKNFERDRVEITLEGKAKGKFHSLRGSKAWHSMSSLKFNLEGRVIVVFYAEEDGTGRQLSVWGNGVKRDVTAQKFDNKAESWAWYKS